jgi:quercetin dioxygenase-like cupin family protein
MIRQYVLPLAILLVVSGAAIAQIAPPLPKFATTRVDLQRHDLSASGREMIQARIDFKQGVFAPMHTHPGEEIIYILEGELEYEIRGQKPVILKTGDVLFVPAGAPHSARNIGSGKGSELATYIVEKGKPLVALPE